MKCSSVLFSMFYYFILLFNLPSEAAQNFSQSRKNEDPKLKQARLEKTNINSTLYWVIFLICGEIPS